ncbi:MAG TPA: hypothetical protein VNQ76_14200 [Planctomicrobium sp.]|nr:hypothetical protein [Planctomicrobium sp.]
MTTALIKLLVSRVGSDFSQVPGQEVEIETGEAWRMVDGGQAVFVGSPPPRAMGEEPTPDVPAANPQPAKPKRTKKPKPTPDAPAGMSSEAASSESKE